MSEVKTNKITSLASNNDITLDPDGTGNVVVKTAASGGTPQSDAGLVLEGPDASRCDLQILGDDGAFQSIYFGDASDADIGSIAYSHSSNSMRFTANAAERMRINSSGFVGIGESDPKKMVHITKNDSDGLIILDADGATTDHQICFAKDYGTGGVTGGNYFGVGVDGSENDFIIAFDANSQASLAADKILSLTHNGNLAVDGSSSTGGADYAEYFEWSDGNSSNEDRRGYSVVLTGNKIRKATSDDATTSIIGVVSSTPACLGDSAWKDWHGKYEKDDYGNYIMQNGERVLSSSYDNTQTYVPRKDRNEWDAIGIVGKLRLRAGQPTGDRWIKMRDISSDVEEWLVR